MFTDHIETLIPGEMVGQGNIMQSWEYTNELYVSFIPSFTSSSGLCCVHLGYKFIGLIPSMEKIGVRIMTKYWITLQFLQ